MGEEGDGGDTACFRGFRIAGDVLAELEEPVQVDVRFRSRGQIGDDGFAFAETSGAKT